MIRLDMLEDEPSKEKHVEKSSEKRERKIVWQLSRAALLP